MKIIDVGGREVKACCVFSYRGFEISCSTIFEPHGKDVAIFMKDGHEALERFSDVDDAIKWAEKNESMTRAEEFCGPSDQIEYGWWLDDNSDGYVLNCRTNSVRPPTSITMHKATCDTIRDVSMDSGRWFKLCGTKVLLERTIKYWQRENVYQKCGMCMQYE